MSQAVENIKPSYPLFRDQEYKDNLALKYWAEAEKLVRERIRAEGK